MSPIFQHLTDPPTYTITDDGTVLNNLWIQGTGSTLGRFLFRGWAPFVVVKSGVKDVWIIGCLFMFGSVAIQMETAKEAE